MQGPGLPIGIFHHAIVEIGNEKGKVRNGSVCRKALVKINQTKIAEECWSCNEDISEAFPMMIIRESVCNVMNEGSINIAVVDL